MKFRPCIDLHNGSVKQIVGGTLTDQNNPKVNFFSENNPSFFAKMFADYNLQGGHIIKLGANNDEAAKEAIKAWPKGLQIGGGITIDSAKEWLNLGASKVIFTSCIFEKNNLNIKKLEKIVEEVGRENITLDLSCRKKEGKYFVVTNKWQTFTNLEVEKKSLQMLSEFCSEFLIHSVDVEGLMNGIDINLINIVKDSPLQCVYAGGVHSFEDLDIIKEIGKDKIDVTIGSALDIYGGNLSFKEIINYFNQKS